MITRKLFFRKSVYTRDEVKDILKKEMDFEEGGKVKGTRGMVDSLSKKYYADYEMNDAVNDAVDENKKYTDYYVAKAKSDTKVESFIGITSAYAGVGLVVLGVVLGSFISYSVTYSFFTGTPWIIAGVLVAAFAVYMMVKK